MLETLNHRITATGVIIRLHSGQDILEDIVFTCAISPTNISRCCSKYVFSSGPPAPLPFKEAEPAGREVEDDIFDASKALAVRSNKVTECQDTTARARRCYFSAVEMGRLKLPGEAMIRAWLEPQLSLCVHAHHLLDPKGRHYQLHNQPYLTTLARGEIGSV